MVFVHDTFSYCGLELYESGSCMVWEINMEVCPRLEFDNFMLSNCLGV